MCSCVCPSLCARFEGAEAAHSIISSGPEPLQSQFTTSYSLVLNLLSVYSLDEAREFLRSGGHREGRGGGDWCMSDHALETCKQRTALEEQASSVLDTKLVCV